MFIFLSLTFVLILSFSDVYAVPVDVKVTISRLVQIHSPDGSVSDNGDFFANVRINNIAFDQTPSIESPDFRPTNWEFTTTVDNSLGTIPLQIQIGDDDGFFRTDGIADINPNVGTFVLDIQLDLISRTWTINGIPNSINQGFSKGPENIDDIDGKIPNLQYPLNNGGSSNIFFDISISSIPGNRS